ncbi:regulatory protein RecX [Rubrolithibacter danxiaensis]|uniref:regulatory protein RecX n=1 Tax=Rubrolithibacter danxiaensis TaxID=3390805 RepID=UPI003BF7FE9B
MSDEQHPQRKVKSKQEALAKAEHFCAYQERSQQEVREKLYSMGAFPSEAEEIISELIQANFLNEERFAISYALGKFRMKKWGRLKIKQGLKLKKVPEKLIGVALKQISADEYSECLRCLLEKKAEILNEKDAFRRRYKLIQFASSKGYEKDLIIDTLKSSDLA